MKKTGTKTLFHAFIAFALLLIAAGSIFFITHLFNGGNAPSIPLGREREITDQKPLQTQPEKPGATYIDRAAPMQFRDRKPATAAPDRATTSTGVSSRSLEGRSFSGENRGMDVASSHQNEPGEGATPAETGREGETPKPTQTPSPSALVYGTVTDQNGQALEKIRITVTGRTGANSQEALTDAAGTYSIEAPPTGDVEIRAVPPVDSNLVASEPKNKTIQEGSEVKEDFVLKEGEFIEGIVVNEKDEPIDQAGIAALMSVGQKMLKTDGKGYFRVAGIPPGQTVQSLVVSHPDYQTQTLTNLNLMDGFQKIVLKQANNIFLKVTWALDGTPVEFYAYRLLRKVSFQDLFIETDRKEILVETPTGITIIDTLEKAVWRVEVTVMSPEREPTDIKGSAEFNLGEGEKGLEILVAIDAGRTIRGIAVLNEKGGAPVEGAQIEFVAPSAGFGRFPPPDKPFLFPTGVTDAAGNFIFDAMPPGRYTLKVQKENFCTPEAFDLIVPYERDPDPVEIVLYEGGKIYGSVVGEGGAPLANSRLVISQQRVNADGWIHKETRTNEEGNYEFAGLTAGSHYIWADGAPGQMESRLLSLGHGEKKEENFNFSGLIQLSGFVRFNGEPAKPGLGFFFLGDNNTRSNWCSVNEEGRYQSFVKPGRATIRFNDPSAPAGEMEPFFIPETPNIQEMDLNIVSVQADVIVQFPQENQFQDGQVVICPEDMMLRYGFYRVKMHQSSRHVVSLFGNKYQATFQSTSGEWHGESDWVALAPGNPNTFLIEVKKTVSGIRLGGWTPGQLSMTEPAALVFDTTAALESAGNINVLALFEKGRHAVETSAVFLFENDACIARDEHKGWSGADHWNNGYILNLDTLAPGARYRIEVLIHSDGGTDSTGSVYLSLN
jgi:hypothetical protein